MTWRIQVQRTEAFSWLAQHPSLRATLRSPPLATLRRSVPRRLPIVLLGCAALAIAGCGKKGNDVGGGPVIGKKGGDESAARALGFPAFATKNTTRVGGADPTADAAGVARAVFAGTSATTKPAAITIVDRGDWQGATAAAVLMSPPVRAPILLSDESDLPQASAGTLAALHPTGSKPVDGAQVIRVGNVAKPKGYKTTNVTGSNPFALAAAIDRLHASAVGRTSDRVVVTTGERPEFAIPAAGWAAKSGDPILYVKRDSVPKETAAALRSHQAPKIYVLGPPDVVSDKVLTQLRRQGTVTRIGGRDPVANAIAFARFVDGRFGWGVVDPGHGLVFVDSGRPLDAAAASPLSATGTYGPILLVSGGALPASLVQYLLDIQPGYERDPVRGVYNHGWIIGDENAISVQDQSRLDSLLEIVPVNAAAPKPQS
jgi:ell wall binding domain 2 (CWB2)